MVIRVGSMGQRGTEETRMPSVAISRGSIHVHHTIAPKGQNMTAQGNALGTGIATGNKP
jgi:hypothetical protein